MSAMQARKNKAKVSAILFGAASIALFAAVFAYADPITALFARGGVYAVLPVATVFLFSWVHGSFAGNVWTALGIEAAKKRPAKAVEKDVRVAPRATAVAN